MRIAIIGAGFSALSVAWHLLKGSPNSQITLFDGKGIGGGASGMAAGLMHPYVGEEGKRSLLAAQGMQASLELIQAVEEELGEKIARRGGLLRYVASDEQNTTFLSHSKRFDDIELYEEGCFHFKSGMTIDCPRYLDGLWSSLSRRGVQWVKEEVTDLQSLKEFDQIVVAAGAGIAAFPELGGLNYSLLKGQVLHCRAPEGLPLPEKSSIGKGYLALTPEKGGCHIGSTYERRYCDTLPDPDLAKNILFPNIARLFPEVYKLQVTHCRAALRVIRKGHYFPIATKVKEGLWVLGAMGSRGLLYHAFLGKLLADAMISGNDYALNAILDTR